MALPNTFMEAVEQCKVYQVPLDPRWVPRGLTDVSAQEMWDFMNNCSVSLCGQKVAVKPNYRQIAYRLGIDITAEGELYGDMANVVLNNLLKIGLRINLEGTGLDFLNLSQITKSGLGQLIESVLAWVNQRPVKCEI